MDDLEYNELINKGRSFAQTSDWDQAIDCYNEVYSITSEKINIIKVIILNF